MEKYGKTWENQNTKLLLECFTKNGVYQESPLAKLYKGREEIGKFWDSVVVGKTSNIKFELGKYYVSDDGKTGFAEWECNNRYRRGKIKKWTRDRMVGIMILKMRGDRISHLNEYWNTESC